MDPSTRGKDVRSSDMNALLELSRSFWTIPVSIELNLRGSDLQRAKSWFLLGQIVLLTALEVAVAAWFYPAAESQSNFGKVCI